MEFLKYLIFDTVYNEYLAYHDESGYYFTRNILNASMMDHKPSRRHFEYSINDARYGNTDFDKYEIQNIKIKIDILQREHI